MRLTKIFALFALLPLTGVFYGCATNTSTSSASEEPTGKAEKRSADEDRGKAIKKISMAIGEEENRFTVTKQQEIEAPAGYNGTQYTVKTRSGKTYKCDILEASGFAKAMTWGMASGAGAMCTDFTPGSKDKGKTNKASCNALLQAAGKC